MSPNFNNYLLTTNNSEIHIQVDFTGHNHVSGLISSLCIFILDSEGQILKISFFSTDILK